MADQKQPEGPDLAVGIDSSSLADGSMQAGRVGDEAVLIARVNGRCFAVGASCTHYGGPLAEGILVGDMVHCPWHHTRFRLSNGVAEAPPAIDPLPCWRVEEMNGRVRVLEKLVPEQRAPDGVRRAHPASVVIVGAGAAGVIAADTLRREGYAGPITIVDGDKDAPVDRPNLSKDYLAGNAPEEWMPMRPEGWFSDRGITLRRGARAAQIDVAAKRLRLDDGEDLAWGALLLATGASPVQLQLPTAGTLPMLTLRTLGDSRAIIAAAERAGAGAKVVVIGASFIGLEVAASLRARNLEVHVVGPETRPLERVLGPQMGDWVRSVHEEHGVVFHLGTRPRELTADAVILENGERLPASFVVAGVGVRPNVSLAEQAKLTVDRGVVVNEQLETSARGIFAAGDIARYPDPATGQSIRVEHWVAAERQAQTAARNMLGAGETFAAAPFFWSVHYDATICYVGHAERWDSIEVEGSIAGRDCELRYIDGGRTAAVATVGRDKESLVAEERLEAASGARG
jgi:NADPH-dependent 2,4-dienoyl-CoA reductase/sulfur reductase-like enzyme/nitrite reductase/ring-hydroxylating ferredoxin subunit